MKRLSMWLYIFQEPNFLWNANIRKMGFGWWDDFWLPSINFFMEQCSLSKIYFSFGNYSKCSNILLYAETT